jgi:hypothetical protein
MGGKAKPTKHTTAEINKKNAAANTNKGGGGAGEADRRGGASGHAKFMCHVCMQQAPDLKSMKEHMDSKHPKVEFDAARYEDLHEKQGGTTQGVGVRGAVGKKRDN